MNAIIDEIGDGSHQHLLRALDWEIFSTVVHPVDEHNFMTLKSYLRAKDSFPDQG